MKSTPELTIQVPIGIGTHIDGGCFFSFDCTEVVDGKLCGDSDLEEGPEKECFDPDHIEDVLTDELRENEPVSITSVNRSDASAIIELPVVPGASIFNGDTDISADDILNSESEHDRASNALDNGGTYTA